MTTDEAVAASAARTDEVVPEETDVAPVWLQRLSLFVLVLFCVYLGVLVAILPWWTRMWDQNIWIQSRPARGQGTLRASTIAVRISPAMRNLIPAKVSGGRSARSRKLRYLREGGSS